MSHFDNCQTQAMKKEVIYPEGGFNENALDLDPDWVSMDREKGNLTLKTPYKNKRCFYI